MGLYGSPDLSKKYGKVEDIKDPKKKKNNKRPQTNIWIWVIILIFDVIFFSTSGFKIDVIFTALILDSVIIALISLINLMYNIIKKNNVKDDIIFLLSSIVFFFVMTYILGTIMNS